MRTLEQIRVTPAGLLSEPEIALLDPAGQAYVRRFLAQRVKEDTCPGHERIETATREQANRGDHRGCCRHCGKNMSYDSGD